MFVTVDAGRAAKAARQRNQALQVKTQVMKMAQAVAAQDGKPDDKDSRPGEVVLSNSLVVHGGQWEGDQKVLAAQAHLKNGKVDQADVQTKQYYHGNERWTGGHNRYTVADQQRRCGLLGLFGPKHPVKVYVQDHVGTYRDDKCRQTVVEDPASGELSLSKRGWRPSFHDFDFKQGLAGAALGLVGAGIPLAGGAPAAVLMPLGLVAGAGLGATACFEHKGRGALVGAATLTGLFAAGAFGGGAGILGASAAMFTLSGLGVFSGGF